MVSAVGGQLNLLGQVWNFTPAPSGSDAAQYDDGTGVTALQLAKQRAGFFERNRVSSKKWPERGAATRDPSLAHRDNHLVQRQIWLPLIKASSQFACFSIGDVLPPRGLDAAFPSLLQRCSHLIAALRLMSKSSAASRRETPLSTLAITRSRIAAE